MVRLAEHLSAQTAISPKTLKPILLSNDFLAIVRKEIKHKTEHNIFSQRFKTSNRTTTGLVNSSALEQSGASVHRRSSWSSPVDRLNRVREFM